MNATHQPIAGGSRRLFLSQSFLAALGLAAGREGEGWAAGAPDKKSRRVLVVGAGVAGLAAASELKSHGFDVVVIEARERVGGRVWTASLQGQPVDLGAQWIEGIEKNPIFAFCRTHAIKSVKSNDDSAVVFDHNGERFGEAFEERLFKQAKELIRKTRLVNKERREKKQADVALAEVLSKAVENATDKPRERRFLRWAIAWEVESEDADDLKHLSLRSYWADPYEVKGVRHVFPDGYGQVPQLLAKGLDIRLGQKVKSVAYDSTGATVETSKGKLQGDFAVITLPLGVLKTGAVTFTPALPKRKLTAIGRLGVGVANKVVLRFPRVFWPKTEFIGYTSDTQGQFVEWTNVAHYTAAPILSIWSHGDYARGLEKLTDAQIEAQAMQVVHKMFPKAARDPVARLVTRWASDAEAGGAYSNLPVGSTLDDFDALAEPVGERLFFAGEATSRDRHGTVNGAYQSGLREARRISQK